MPLQPPARPGPPLRRALPALWLAALVPASTFPTRAVADAFADHIRSTPPRAPEEERQGFKLPEGFVMQLFAAEPEIGKPINIAFDARGRLWVTESREYPFPAPPDRPGQDAIKILEDTDGDGRADKITTFADGLNIPIGVLPFGDGAIAWSIPNIWHLRDTDGDGKADRREILYGPLGWEADSHGMSNTYRRGLDGWMYLSHGYSNTSTVKGKDGSALTMHSGNVYRVRTDGGRVEPWSYGQVNPFGSAFDRLNQLYTADCHSSVMTHVLRGAYYPSFGKPHDGLGFGPAMIQHNHGSTAIAGLAYYDEDLWPAAFKDNIFIGNVTSSAVNRDQIAFTGSSPRAIEMPDLVGSDDGWFRPVDLAMGPDGALYIADFYNRIIGHYEVPLDHPGRDRERGRIWRLVYAPGGKPAVRSPVDLTKASIAEVAAALASPSLATRTLATHVLADRGGRDVIAAARAALVGPSADAAAHALWVLRRTGAIDAATLAAAARHQDRAVRAHAQQVLADLPRWTPAHRKIAATALSDADPAVVRAAADALARHPAFDDVKLLSALVGRAPAEDPQLVHAARIALRDVVAAPGTLRRLTKARLPEADAARVADVALGVPTPDAGAFLLGYLKRAQVDADLLRRLVAHAARHLDGKPLDALAAFAEERFADAPDEQLLLYRTVLAGAEQRGRPPTPAATAWGKRLARQALASIDDASLAWGQAPVEDARSDGNPWYLETVKRYDGAGEVRVLTSRPAPRTTGVLRSPPFELPETFSFFMAGWDHVRGQPPEGRTFVRIRRLATGEALAQWSPAPSEMAQQVTLEAPPAARGAAVLELVDGHYGTHGWVAVGGFDPALLDLPKVAPATVAGRAVVAAQIAARFELKDSVPTLERLLASDGVDLETRGVLARALARLAPDDALAVATPLVQDAQIPADLRLDLARALARDRRGGDAWREVVARGFASPSYSVQLKIAQALAATKAGADELLRLVEAQLAPARLLREGGVMARLDAQGLPPDHARLAPLTRGVTAVDPEIQRLIDESRHKFHPSRVLLDEGQRLYTLACQACHQLAGQGGQIGPSLDGIAGRGVERILEDILDPSRNIDEAFRPSYLTLADGEVVFGLPRREEGAVVVVADAAGNERAIPKAQVKSRQRSETSLMPENFGEMFSSEQLTHLVGYLLAKTGARTGAPR